MSLIDALLLGTLQGITEFLPISSSGHLALAETFLGLNTASLKSFDIAIHFGTLLAILTYFRKDFLKLWQAFWISVGRFLKIPLKREFSAEQREELQNYQKLIVFLILGTLPAVIVGFLWGDSIDQYLRNPFSILIFLGLVGIVFIVIELLQKKKEKKPLNSNKALIIGLAQACALIPGVSRSGATIITSLFVGLKREEAARFSFLLGAIAIFAASLLTLVQVFKGTITLLDPLLTLIGVVTSFLMSFLVISFFMKFIRKHTLIIFGVYRIILASSLLIYLSSLAPLSLA